MKHNMVELRGVCEAQPERPEGTECWIITVLDIRLDNFGYSVSWGSDLEADTPIKQLFGAHEPLH